MITRIFGMYRVKLYHLRRNVKFVIMNSVYQTDKYMQTFYDLKGSALGRDAKPGQAVQKDNDLRRDLPSSSLALGDKQRKAVKNQVEADCSFLNRMGIMDYSMLVGIHHIPVKEDYRKGHMATLGYRPSKSGVASHVVGESESESSDLDPLHLKKSTSSADNFSSKRRAMSESHRLSESIGAFFVENGLDEDDGSYLEGAEGNPSNEERTFNPETEKKKQATIEKLFWPFHKLFDIHGNRLMKPVLCPNCSSRPCECTDGNLLEGYSVPQFVPPLSNRKDHGFEMDTTGQVLPMRFKGQKGEEFYDGKIFYMGIIDVLQEYTSRKAIEASYRLLRSNKNQASCVAPADYASRFVDFFEEYTQPLGPDITR